MYAQPFIRVVDFETTDEPPNCDVIEAGWYDIEVSRHYVVGQDQMFVKPSRKIELGAKAVHHLSDEDVENGVSHDYMESKLIFQGPVALAAHNAVVERGLVKVDIPFICTMKCAMALFPQAGKFSNQYLRYYLELNVDPQLATPPHRALPDAYVTSLLLIKLLEKAPYEELINITNNPVLLQTVPVGKYRGQPWSAVDVGYLRWVLGQDFDENVLYTAKTELSRRTGGRV